MADVQLTDISKSFGNNVALSHIDLTINDGDFVVLLGPTGAGKTTMLRVVAGLEKPDQGNVFINGERVNDHTPAMRDVSFVFQQYSLYPHLSVFDNLAFPLRSPARRQSRESVTQRVHEVASMLSIEHKLQNRATQLSGGEMQRVAIGRALVREPSIYLMDEPLSSLDAKLRGDLRIELKRIQQDQGATILYVTHDQIEAMTMASHVGVLHEGRLVQFGSPRHIYTDPDNEYVATRLGVPPVNLVPVDEFAVAISHGPTPPPGSVTLGLRTENIVLATSDSTATRTTKGHQHLIGIVADIEHLGDQIRLSLDVNGSRIVTLADPHRRFDRGQELALDIRQPLYFDKDKQRIRL